MNVYDFDETMYSGDCEDCFFEYIFKTYKKELFLYHLNFLWWTELFKNQLIDKTTARQGQYMFLRKLDRMGKLDEILEDFWDKHQSRLKKWYLEQKNPEDIIASATPSFLIKPILKRLGLHNLVATDMDEHTGKINGWFAAGEYKLDNFKKQFDTSEIDDFYSDAWSDHFVAEKAKHAFVIHDGDKIDDWNTYFNKHPELKDPSTKAQKY